MTIKEWTFNGQLYRNLKPVEPVNYVTVSPITGEIQNAFIKEDVQLSLF